MSIFIPAYYFFPMLGGVHVGSFFGQYWRVHLNMTMYTFFLSSELPAIVWCFVYRHNAVVDLKKFNAPRRLFKRSMILLVELFPFAACFCMYMSEITPAEVHAYLEKNYPQCVYWEHSSHFVAYDVHANSWVAVTGVGAMIMVLLCSVAMTILAAHTMYLLHQIRLQLSTQTFKIQRDALISLSLQVIVPAVVLIIPVFTCFYVVLFDLVEFQGFATNVTILIGCHSVTSSLVMILTNPRYRRHVVDMLRVPGVPRNALRNHAMVSSSSHDVS